MDGGEAEGGEMKMNVPTAVNEMHPQDPEAFAEPSVGVAVEPLASPVEAEEPSPETPGVPRPPCGYSAVSSRLCSTDTKK